MSTIRPKNLFDDTSHQAEAKLIELLRTKTSEEKLNMVNQLNASVRVMLISGLRLRYPDADDGELKRRLAEHLLGEERARIVLNAQLMQMQAEDE